VSLRPGGQLSGKNALSTCKDPESKLQQQDKKKKKEEEMKSSPHKHWEKHRCTPALQETQKGVF
jgi:hypothetical protein